MHMKEQANLTDAAKINRKSVQMCKTAKKKKKEKKLTDYQEQIKPKKVFSVSF